ncbi:uncharacterized protein A1O9_04612, partial [Exophiala aquamarina CBS 119918]
IMPKGPTKRPKVKRNDRSDSETSDEDEPRHFFVPGERINSEVLSFFLFNYVDKRPKIRPCPHPTDKTRFGFNVTARDVLTTLNLRDILADSRDWDTEQSAKSFEQRPYRYHESATAKRRLRAGPSKDSSDQSAQHAQTKATSPPISNAVPAGAYNQFSQQQQQQQSSDYSRPGGGYFPGTSKPENPSNTYNINYTAVNAQYTANVPSGQLPGNSNLYTKPYPSTNYPAQISSTTKHPYDIPPTYEQSTVRAPPRKPQPGQPDPDVMDREYEPARASPMEIPGSRQGSLAPAEEQSNRAYSSSNNRPGESYNSRNPRQSQYE